MSVGVNESKEDRMNLFDRLGNTMGIPVDQGAPWDTAVDAISALASLVVRCDRCGGKGTIMADCPNPPPQPKSGWGQVSCAVLHLKPCPARCVDGWQPSEALNDACDGPTAPYARAVLRLLGGVS